MLHQRIEKLNGVEHIVGIILQGDFNGLPYICIGRKMHDRIDMVFFKAILQVGRIADISPVKITPLYKFPVSINEIVDGDRAMALPVQFLTAVRPDISGPAGYKYV